MPSELLQEGVAGQHGRPPRIAGSPRDKPQQRRRRGIWVPVFLTAPMWSSKECRRVPDPFASSRDSTSFSTANTTPSTQRTATAVLPTHPPPTTTTHQHVNRYTMPTC